MKILLLFVCAIALQQVQCISNRGKEFYIAYFYHDRGSTAGHNDLLISGTQNTNIRVECQNPYLNFTLFLPANGFIRYQLPGNVRVTRAGLETKGVRVTADEFISVHGTNAADGTVDGFLVVQTDRFFTEFLIPSYNPLSTRYSQFVIVGTTDTTRVWVSRPTGGGNFVPYSNFTLGYMQTYTFLSTSVDFTGYLVQSDKPVSVFGGHECANVPFTTQYCDMLAVNVPPISALGQDYIVPPILGRSTTAGYVIRVIGAHANTNVNITRGGITLATTTVQKGTFYEYSSTATQNYLRVSCSENCTVVQYNKGGTLDSTRTDPYMLLVTPTNTYSNELSWTTSQRYDNSLFNNYVSIVSTGDQRNNIRIDNNTVPSSWTSVSGNGDFYYTAFSVTDGGHVLTLANTNDPIQAFAAFAYGHSMSNEESYGYQAGFFIPDELLPIPPTLPPGSLIPVLDIVVNGSFVTSDGSALTQTCSSAYANALRNKNFLMALQVTGLLGTELCDSSFLGHELLTADVSFIGSAAGGIARTGVFLPGLLTRTFGEMHNCGRNISLYLQDHNNWGRPVLGQEPGCPAITFVPERFDHYDWIWRCITP